MRATLQDAWMLPPRYGFWIAVTCRSTLLQRSRSGKPLKRRSAGTPAPPRAPRPRRPPGGSCAPRATGGIPSRAGASPRPGARRAAAPAPSRRISPEAGRSSAERTRAAPRRAAPGRAPRNAAAGTRRAARPRRGARRMPNRRNGCARASRFSYEYRVDRAESPHRERERDRHRRHVEATAAPVERLREEVPQPDRGMDADGGDEQCVERRPRDVAARAPEYLGGGQPASHSVDDG